MPIDWDLNKRIAIRDLGVSATKTEIKTLFGQYGKIEKLWVARNPPGLAFLEYSKRHEAEIAASRLDGKRCCGCYIKVDLSRNHPLPSGSRRDSRKEVREFHRCSRHKKEPTSSSSSHNRSLNELVKKVPCRRRHEQRRIETQSESEETLSRSRNSDKQRLDCSICFENLLKRRPTITTCRHIFCSSCIRRAVQLKGKCPICQTDAQEKDLQTVYLNA